jgi:glycosyltransferase involved in cell wall biosynthesis
MRILHLIERLTGAGPTRGLVSLAKHQRQLGMRHRHSVVTLERESYPLALVMAAQAGIEISRQPDPAALRERISDADIVQFSFWNNPALYRLLRSEWPASRLLLRLHVLGESAPQVVTPDLVDLADFAVATSPRTLNLPELGRLRPKMQYVLAALDTDRLLDFAARPHEGFQVAYIGTTTFAKMHSGFVSMSGSAQIPGVRFVVCGAGGNDVLQRQAEQLGVASRFWFRGFVEDVKSVLETADVFGYPLCHDTSAASETSLQEAMYAGVPPVVFPHAGVRDLVRHQETGLVVKSELEYTQALEYLFRNPSERERLGRNARAFAQAHFLPDTLAREMDAIYRKMMESPKRERQWSDAQRAPSPAGQFIAALGTAAPQFRASMDGQDPEADDQIAHSSAQLASGEGGIFQYRNAYPDDPYLRFWAGLALLGRQRFTAACAEMQAAIQLGLSPARVEPYLGAIQSTAPVA